MTRVEGCVLKGREGVYKADIRTSVDEFNLELRAGEEADVGCDEDDDEEEEEEDDKDDDAAAGAAEEPKREAALSPPLDILSSDPVARSRISFSSNASNFCEKA